MKPTIECPTCGGSGRAPLPDALQETLNVLPRRGQFTAAEIHAKIPGKVEVTAINNRLESLRALSLLTRERFGKFWKYSRA